jgi:glycosyltransferase involved in cell wall biosynthesis
MEKILNEHICKVVYDNIAFSLQKSGGVSGVWHELISRISKKQEFDCSFLEYEHAKENINRKNFLIPNHAFLKTRKIPLKLERFLNLELSYPDHFIFHSSYYRTCSSAKAKNVTTVHDFIHERFRSGIPLYINHLQKKKALLNSDAIICVSESTKKDLLYYIPTIKKEKIFVVYNGIDNTVFKKLDMEKPSHILSLGNYVVYVGKREQTYKNFGSLVNALKEHPDLNLALVGGDTPSIKEMENLKKKLDGRVQYLANVDNQKLNILYNFSFALVYPSLYEGFGMPVIEAQSAGCPVIATNCSSIPEIVLDSAILTNSGSATELSQSLELLKNDAVRTTFINKGLSNATRFSWDKMGNEVADIYKAILNYRYK